MPVARIYDDGRERRIFCEKRYQHSRRLLRQIIRSLPSRRIFLADDQRANFITYETTENRVVPALYAVFFEVFKDRGRRGKRLVLRVQSAYVLDRGLSRRQRSAKRVTLRSILQAALEGRRIRP
jgi:hypothetical protein